MYLIDSSVILKWFFLNEEAVDKAYTLYKSMQVGESVLATDSSVIHEVANVLHSKGNLSANEIVRAMSLMFDDGLLLVKDEQRLLLSAINIGLERKIGTHDAVLITAAIKGESTLITADHLLYKVAKEYTNAFLLQDMHI